MAAQVPLAQVATTIDSVAFSGYAYPAGSIFEEVNGIDANGTARKVHRIYYYGTTFTASQWYAAPLGSRLTHVYAGSVKEYVYTVQDTTWAVVGSQS